MPSLLYDSLEQASGLSERKEEYGFKVIVSQLDYFLVPYSDLFSGAVYRHTIRILLFCYVDLSGRDLVIS